MNENQHTEEVPAITLAHALESGIKEDSDIGSQCEDCERIVNVFTRKVRLKISFEPEGSAPVPLQIHIQSMPHSGRGTAFNILFQREQGQHSFLFIVSSVEKAKEECAQLTQAFIAYANWAIKESGASKDLPEDWEKPLASFIPDIKRQVLASEQKGEQPQEAPAAQQEEPQEAPA